MPAIVATFVDTNGDPVSALADDPEIQIRRTDTGAIVQAFDAMTFIGDGTYQYSYTIPSTTEDYSFVVNGDPGATGQVPDSQVTKSGGFSGLIDSNESAIDTNLDATVSSRSAPGDAMDLVANAVDSAAVATDAIDADALATDAVNEIRDGILSDSTPFNGADVAAVLADTAAMQPLVDVATSTRAAPGDAMTLTAGAEASAVDAVWDEPIAGHLTAGSTGEALDDASASVISQQDVRDAMKLAPTAGAPAAGSVDQELDDILADTGAMEPLITANIDATVSSRATQADILSDATPFAGANVDAAISSRSSHTPADVDTQLSGTHGAGSWEGSALLPYAGAIWIDVANGAAGTVVGTNGTPDNPVNSLADAVTLAGATGFREYRVRDGDLVLPSAHTDWRFVSLGTGVTLDINGQNVDGSNFVDFYIYGTVVAAGVGIQCFSGGIGPVTGLAGYLYGCALYGTIGVSSGLGLFGYDCQGSSQSTSGVTIDAAAFGPGDAAVLHNTNGNLRIANLASATARISIAGNFTLDVQASCTAGQLLLSGVGDLNDLSGGSLNLFTDGFVQHGVLVDDIHEEPMADHASVAGSAAQYLVAAGGGAGGMHVVFDGGSGAPNASYSANNQLTQGRLRFFDTQANAVAATPGTVALETGELFRTEIQSGDATLTAGNIGAVPEVLQQLIRRGP